MKRGQVSIFILLGLLLALFIGFFVFYTQKAEEPLVTLTETETEKAVNALVLSCLEPIAEEALFVSAFQGGYIEFDDTKDTIDQRQIHYYYYYGDVSPNLTFVYDLLGAYIINRTSTCVEESTLFQTKNITLQEESATVLIFSQENTIVDITLPITVYTEGKTETVSEFSTTIPVAFEKMYAVAQQITTIVEESDPLTCMTCIHDLATSFDMTITVNDYEQTADYYVLFDPHSLIYDVPLAFSFAVQTQQDFDPIERLYEEKSISLELPVYNATVGEPFSLNINTDDFLQQVIPEILANPSYTLTFADFTPLLDIDPVLGTIAFTPTEEQRGTHNVIIKITDTKGQVEYTSFQVIVS